MRIPSYIFVIIKPLLDICIVAGSFFLAYFLRTITDGIPFIQLRIPYISLEQFFPYSIAGVLIWLIIFGQRKLYGHFDDIPLVEEIRRVFIAGCIWLIAFVGLVYFATGPIFSKEIPRLIVLYTFIFSISFSLIARAILYRVYQKYISKYTINRIKLLVVYKKSIDNARKLIDLEKYHCNFLKISNQEDIEKNLKNRIVDAIVLTLDNPYGEAKFIFEQAKIYGIPCLYPQILPHMSHFSRREKFIGNTPMFELSTISIGFWQSVLKRIFDILFSSISLIILSPVFLMIYIGIKIEDFSGPAIYKNRRVGKNEKLFTLYKFRYMYWKDSVKDAYGQSREKDEALAYEESLKQTNNGRNGPLYKIQNDPRKMRF